MVTKKLMQAIFNNVKKYNNDKLAFFNSEEYSDFITRVENFSREDNDPQKVYFFAVDQAEWQKYSNIEAQEELEKHKLVDGEDPDFNQFIDETNKAYMDMIAAKHPECAVIFEENFDPTENFLKYAESIRAVENCVKQTEDDVNLFIEQFFSKSHEVEATGQTNPPIHDEN
jgi:hypothetical protein